MNDNKFRIGSIIEDNVLYGPSNRIYGIGMIIKIDIDKDIIAINYPQLDKILILPLSSLIKNPKIIVRSY